MLKSSKTIFNIAAVAFGVMAAMTTAADAALDLRLARISDKMATLTGTGTTTSDFFNQLLLLAPLTTGANEFVTLENNTFQIGTSPPFSLYGAGSGGLGNVFDIGLGFTGVITNGNAPSGSAELILGTQVFAGIGTTGDVIGIPPTAVVDLANVVGSYTITPIPAALPLLGTALAGLGFVGWRRRKAGQASAAA